MGFATSCIRLDDKTSSWKAFFKTESGFLRDKTTCFWADRLLSGLHSFKSPVAQDVYQAQISSISLEGDKKSMGGSQTLTGVPRKVCWSSRCLENDDVKEVNEEYFEEQLLDFVGVRSEMERATYRRSLISQRAKSNDRSMSLSMSFLSTLLKDSPENQKKASVSLRAYQEIISTLEKHLADRQNTLSFLFSEFTGQFLAVLAGKMKGISIENKEFRTFYEGFAADTKDFIEILQGTLCLYYNIEHLAEACPDFVFFTKENLMNFLFDLFFKREGVYEAVLRAEGLASGFNEEKLSQNLQDLEGYTVKDFSIPQGLINPNKGEPFEEAVRILRTIGHNRSPIQKMRVILRASDSITHEVGQVSKELLNGDDTLLILLFVVARAKVQGLNAQLGLVERYAGKGLMMARSGYYFATIQVCARHLEEEGGRDLLLRHEKMEGLKRASEAISWGRGKNLG